jgi:hypothetical protein
MNRLALALALATTLAGTGCYVAPACNSRNVSVAWSGFDGPSNLQVNLSCASANVPFVDLFLDGTHVAGPLPSGHFSCSDYGEIVAGVPDGNHVMTVEGIAADGLTINYRDEVSFGASGCGDFALPTATPAAGTVDLHYTFQSGSSCSPGAAYMWFSIFDVIANATDPVSIDATSSLAAKRTFPCSLIDPVVTLPAGTYQLDAMSENVESPATFFTQTAYLCKAPIGFSVNGRAQTVLNPSLADVGGAACLP